MQNLREFNMKRMKFIPVGDWDRNEEYLINNPAASCSKFVPAMSESFKDSPYSLGSKIAECSLDDSHHEALFNPDFDFSQIESNQRGAKTRSLKDQLLYPTEEDYRIIKNDLDLRINEGQGECLYEIGIENSGASLNLTPQQLELCIGTVREAAKRIDAEISVLCEKLILTASINNGEEKNAQGKSEAKTAHILVRKRPKSMEELLEVRVAVVGNVSTLLGVLTKGLLDDGRGKARVNLFRHKHEFESGRTSSVGMEIMGFTADSKLIQGDQRKLSWDDICVQAAKVLSFIDLAGHEKYLRTTVFGMTGCAPDFVMLMVGANAGIIGMAKEHLGLALALSVPVYVVITKIDMCPLNVLENTIKQLTKLLKSPGCRKIPIFIKSLEDVVLTAQNFKSERLCPIFQVSNGLDLLKSFLNILPANGHYDISQPVEFQITDTFSVPFVGTVVSGVLMTGVVHVGDHLLIGPDSLGHFQITTVKSIQRKRVNVPLVNAGQSASFALKRIRRSAIRKGMVMLSKTETPPKAVQEFEAEILVLYHSSTINQRYQAMLHCGTVRQTVSIVSLGGRSVLRTGDRATVTFRFLKTPEYIKVGSKLIFREGRTKGVGKVSKLL
ncbi:uncharacterized protein VTP21DRAFT_193 [Calcarisporiella thermophila]|uniref:uncharacterized protein n=1 Tax=Calcarisporiella thermophila TaxID=911321 RepID=UPI00374307B6